MHSERLPDQFTMLIVASSARLLGAVSRPHAVYGGRSPSIQRFYCNDCYPRKHGSNVVWSATTWKEVLRPMAVGALQVETVVVLVEHDAIAMFAA